MILAASGDCIKPAAPPIWVAPHKSSGCDRRHAGGRRAVGAVTQQGVMAGWRTRQGLNLRPNGQPLGDLCLLKTMSSGLLAQRRARGGRTAKCASSSTSRDHGSASTAHRNPRWRSSGPRVMRHRVMSRSCSRMRSSRRSRWGSVHQCRQARPNGRRNGRARSRMRPCASSTKRGRCARHPTRLLTSRLGAPQGGPPIRHLFSRQGSPCVPGELVDARVDAHTVKLYWRGALIKVDPVVAVRRWHTDLADLPAEV